MEVAISRHAHTPTDSKPDESKSMGSSPLLAAATDQQDELQGLWDDPEFASGPDSPNLLTALLDSAETSAEVTPWPDAAEAATASRANTVRWAESDTESDDSAASAESRLSTFSMHLAKCASPAFALQPA